MNPSKVSDANSLDAYIAQRMRQWQALMPPPPAWGRARLLRRAALLQLQMSQKSSPWKLLFHHIYGFFEYVSYLIAYERPNQDLEMGQKVLFFSTSSREDIMRTYTARMALFGFIS